MFDALQDYLPKELLTDGVWQNSVRIFVILVLLVAMGKMGSWLLQKLASWYIDRSSRKEDPSDTGVIRLKRRATQTSSLSALFRTALYSVLVVIGFGLIFPHGQSVVVGGALVAALIGFALQPLIRDLFAGISMVLEGWFDVGDVVMIEPWNLQGTVEKINLRSTQLRSVSGEKIIVHNSFVYGVRVLKNSLRPMTLEFFAKDRDRGEQLVTEIATLLPQGAKQVAKPLTVTKIKKIGDELYRIVCHAQVSPGREWLLEDYAVKLFHERDEEQKIIVHGPLVYYQETSTSSSRMNKFQLLD